MDTRATPNLTKPPKLDATIRLRLSPDLRAKLGRYASEHDQSESAVVRAAIVAYLNESAPATEQTKPKSRQS